jgi:enoyl-[acyl-carrier protein] reductase III
VTESLSLTGKNVLVTGGTRGIGRAISLGFAEAGARVIANYVRAREPAEELSARARDGDLAIDLCRADLTSPRGLDAIEAAVRERGGLHVLVHCAATGVHKPFAELTPRHYDWTFALNVRAFFELVHRLLPLFGPDASILVLSSQGAARAIPSYSLIGASKGALEALARHMAVELAPRRIRVNILCPGAVATDVWDVMPGGRERLADLEKRTPTLRLADVGDVAQAALFLTSDAARSIVGHTLVIDGGAGLVI